MANLTKLELTALDISRNNYLTWDGNEESEQNKARSMIFIHHHLHEGLKFEYLGEKYDHQKSVIIPQSRYEWMHLGFKKYFELISCLLVAEQNNNLLMKNHNSHPTVIIEIIKNGEKQDKGNTMKFGPPKKQNESCYKCRANGHWTTVCRTSRHLVDLYQASIKGKGKANKINFIDFNNHIVDSNDPMDFTHLDVDDFLTEPSGEIGETLVMRPKIEM
ncbi:hypothetical protein ABFS83_12G049600 [Erythranthe nasuta]